MGIQLLSFSVVPAGLKADAPVGAWPEAEAVLAKLSRWTRVPICKHAKAHTGGKKESPTDELRGLAPLLPTNEAICLGTLQRWGANWGKLANSSLTLLGLHDFAYWKQGIT